MDEAEQRQFLARFTETGAGHRLRGAGRRVRRRHRPARPRLIGAFIATLGLPQVNPVNEQLRQRMEAMFGAGYDYAYLYPGLQKVVQAAGRVIRTPERPRRDPPDRRPLRRGEVQRLLPRWWMHAPS